MISDFNFKTSCHSTSQY